jgi:hypothetical protein
MAKYIRLEHALATGGPVPSPSLPRIAAVLLLLAAPAVAQETDLAQVQQILQRQSQSLGHRIDVLERQIDNLMFFNRLGDIAEIDIVRLTGPALRHEPNPTAQGTRSGSTPTSSFRRTWTARRSSR